MRTPTCRRLRRERNIKTWLTNDLTSNDRPNSATKMAKEASQTNSLKSDPVVFKKGLPRNNLIKSDMKFPIDIVWFNNGVVVDMAPNVQLEPEIVGKELKVYYPRDDVNMFLEFRAGWISLNKLKIGDKIEVVE